MDTTSIEPGELVRHIASLRRLAQQLVRDPDRAEDLVQGTLLKGLERAPAGLKEPLAWLKRVLRSAAVDEHRRRQVQEDVRGDLERELRTNTHEQPGLAAADLLLHAVRSLDPNCREVIDLRFFQDASVADAAARLGIPVNTLRSRQARALANLRERMRQESDRGGSWKAALIPLLRIEEALTTSFTFLSGALVMKKFSLAIGLLGLVSLGWLFRPNAAQPDSAAGGPIEGRVASVTLVEGSAGPNRTVADRGARSPELAIVEEIPQFDPVQGSPALGPSVPLGDSKIELVAVDERGEPVECSIYRIPNPSLWNELIELLDHPSAASKKALDGLLRAESEELGTTPLQVRVPTEPEFLVARTSWALRAGSIQVVPTSEPTLEVSVLPATFLDVRVASPTGRPAPGYELKLAETRPGESRLFDVKINPAEDTTDDRGYVRLVLEKSLEELISGGSEYQLQGLLVGDESASLALETSWFNTTEAVELVVSEWGELEVELIWDGLNLPIRISARALPVEATTSFDEFKSTQAIGPWASSDSGVLAFDHLPVGRNWNIWIDQGHLSDDLGPFTIRGPVEPGEVAKAQIRLPNPSLTVFATLLDGQGMPVREERLWTSIAFTYPGGEEGSMSTSLVTDGDGLIALHLDSRDDELLALTSWELYEESIGLRWFLEFDPPLRETVRDLGDWQGESMALVASGVVDLPEGIDPRGYIQLYRETREPGAPWEYANASGRIDAAGQFKLVDADGVLDPSETYFLQGRVGLHRTNRVRIALGQTDVVLRILPTGIVAGKFKFPDTTKYPKAKYYFVPAGAALTEAVATSWAGNHVGLNFVAALPAGVYDLHIFDLEGTDPVRIIEGISVEPGETTRDPRLQPFLFPDQPEEPR